jgi:hypothetical protein
MIASMEKPNRPALSEFLQAKADPALRQALRSLNFDPSVALPVVVVLHQPPPAAQPAPSGPEEPGWVAFRNTFEREVQPVVDLLRAAGATDIKPNWISHSVAARAPLPAIEGAARRSDTTQIVLDVRRSVLA